MLVRWIRRREKHENRSTDYIRKSMCSDTKVKQRDSAVMVLLATKNEEKIEVCGMYFVD